MKYFHYNRCVLDFIKIFMSLEKLNEAPGGSVESIDRKEYKETIEQKRRIRELIPYLKDDPNKVLAEEFWGKKNIVYLCRKYEMICQERLMEYYSSCTPGLTRARTESRCSMPALLQDGRRRWSSLTTSAPNTATCRRARWSGCSTFSSTLQAIGCHRVTA